MRIKIGRWEFKTKIEAEGRIRGILGRHGQRAAITGDDLELVTAILELHPNRDVVIDCGIKRIEVEHLHDKYNSRRFILVRTDSSIRDFAWRHALYPRNVKQSIMRACRTAIREQVDECRRSYFADNQPKTCPLRGTPITLSDSHVDHKPPDTFEALVERWLKVNQISYEDIELVAHKDFEKPTRMLDVFLEENWREFHRDNSVLRVVSAAANLSDSRKGSHGV